MSARARSRTRTARGKYVLGLRPFEHWVFRSRPEGVPSGPGDLDLTIYGLRKYYRLALKGSPTVLLLLFIAVLANLHDKTSELERALLAADAPEEADRQAVDAS